MRTPETKSLVEYAMSLVQTGMKDEKAANRISKRFSISYEMAWKVVRTAWKRVAMEVREERERKENWE